jgi:hypothetical protein
MTIPQPPWELLLTHRVKVGELERERVERIVKRLRWTLGPEWTVAILEPGPDPTAKPRRKRKPKPDPG